MYESFIESLPFLKSLEVSMFVLLFYFALKASVLLGILSSAEGFFE